MGFITLDRHADVSESEATAHSNTEYQTEYNSSVSPHGGGVVEG